MNMVKDEREFHLLKYGKGKKQCFVLIFLEDNEIWLDIKWLPNSCILCACCDGVPLRQVQCTKNITRSFLPMEWLINDWGAGKEWIDALQCIKEKTIKNLAESTRVK